MNPQDIDIKLAEYAAGELSPAEAAALRAAAAANPGLAARIAELDAQDTLLAQYYGSAARAALSAPRPALPPLHEKAGRSRLAWPVYAVAAIFALFVVAGAVLLSWHGVQTALSDVELGVASVVEGSVLYFSDDGLKLVKEGMPITSKMRVKVPSRSYLQIRLAAANAKAGTNILEVRENTVAEFKDYSEQTVLNLEKGEVWVHLNLEPPKQFAVKTRDHLIRHEGTIFNVVQGLTGTAIGVMQGSVSYDEAGAPVSLTALGTHTSFESAGAYSLAGHIPWSRYKDKLFAMLPGGMNPAAPGTIPLLADQSRAAAAPAVAPDPALGEEFGTHAPADYLPANTRLLVSIADVGDVLSDWNASEYSDLFRDPALQEWWDSTAMEDFRHKVENELGLPRWIRLITSVPDGLSVGIAHDGSVVMIGDCRNDYAAMQLIYEEDIAPLLEAWAAGTKGQSRDHFTAELTRGFLVIGIQDGGMTGLAQTMAALASDTPTGFTTGDFYHKVEDNAPGSRLTIAFDFKSTFQIIQAKGDASMNKFLARTGFEKLDYILGSPDFAGAGINQAFRVGFTGERSGVLGWIDAPGPMSSLRFFSGDAHAFAAMRVKSPEVMLRDLLSWLSEDHDGQAAPEAEQKILDHLGLLAACLGNEVAAGLQNPVLPIPNVQIAVEANDPERFRVLFSDFIAMLNESVAVSPITLTETTYRDYRIVTVTHPDMIVPVAFVMLDDFIVFGPGLFLERTVDVFEDRQSLMDQQAFRSLLPETGRMNFSMLFFQDLSRAIPRMVDTFKQQALTTREQGFVPSFDLMGRFHKAGISYAISYDDHMDFHMNGSRGVDFNLGGTMPFVASLIIPKIVQHDTEHLIMVTEKRLDLLRLALDGYKTDNGRYPDSLVELLSPVQYMSEVPGDPFAADRAPLLYTVQPEQGRYMIYSIGPDEKDNLGLRRYDSSKGLRSEGDILYTNDEEWNERASRAVAE